MHAGFIRPAAAVADTVTQPPPKPRDTLMWCNGQWTIGYHRNFFDGMMKEHIRQIEGYKNKQREEIAIRAKLACGEAVRVNKVAFKYKDNKLNSFKGDSLHA